MAFKILSLNSVIPAAVCENPIDAINAVRKMGLVNPVHTNNAWHDFYAIENGKPVFHTQLLKVFLFNHGFITENELNDNLTPLQIAGAVYNAFCAGIFPIKCTKQTGIKGYSPFRLSRDFQGKMLKKWAFSTLSLVNPFCLKRMKDNTLVCSECYVEASLRRNIIGMLNYIQNYFLMQFDNIPAELIPVIQSINLKTRDGVRIESFGDIASKQQQTFYVRLCQKNPLFHFTQWTKNPNIVCQVFDTMGKPENLKIGLSMSRINKMDDGLEKWEKTGYFDFYFVVVDNDETRDKLLSIPFARPCHCLEGSCYDATICAGCYMAENPEAIAAGRPVTVVERLRKQ